MLQQLCDCWAVEAGDSAWYMHVHICTSKWSRGVETAGSGEVVWCYSDLTCREIRAGRLSRGVCK